MKLIKSETTTEFIEPYDTISWAAWSLYSEEFYNKWEAGQISFMEYKNLIDACIAHVQQMRAGRSVFQSGLKKKDQRRLELLRIVRSGLCLKKEEAEKYTND